MKWYIPVAIFIVVAISLAPTASATTVTVVELGDVVFMTTEGEISIDTTDVHTFNVNINNKGSTPASVRMTQGSGSGITLSMDSDIVVDAGKTVAVTVTVTPNDYLEEGMYAVSINLSSIVSGTETTGTMQISVILESVYSSSAFYNTVLGIFTLPEPFNIEIISVAVSIVIWLAIALVMAYIGAFVIRLIYASKDRKGRDTEKTMFVYMFLSVCILGVSVVARVLGLSEEVVASVDKVRSYFTIIFGAVIFWTFYKAFIYNVIHRMEEKSNIEGISVIPMMNLVGKVAIVAVTVCIVLSSAGVDIAGVIASAGLSSLGVSLGAKPVINEFFSGLVVLITRPFVKGDRVKIGSGNTLAVEKVNVTQTIFLTGYTNEVIVYPNSTMTSSTITNLSWLGKEYRLTAKFRVPYGTDIPLAKELIKQAAMEHDGVVKGDAVMHDPVVIISNTFDHGTVVLTLAFYSKEYADSWDFLGGIYESVIKKFRENGLRIAPYQLRYNIINGGEASAL